MGWRVPRMMSRHSRTSHQLPEKRPRGSSMEVRSATVRVPSRSPGCDHELGELFGDGVGGHEGAGAYLDVEHEGVKGFGEFLAHDAGGDEEGRLDGAGVVAHAVEDAIGGDEARGLADERGARSGAGPPRSTAWRAGCRSREWFSSLSSVPPVWAEGTAGDHGDADAGDAFAIGDGEAGRGEDGRDEE